MSETKKRYGYTGKGLRVNLTTGKFTVEPTFPRFNGLIGGTAFGYRVLWDEVPPDTDCYSPENNVVIAPGPLSGTGAICSGRTALTTLWPTSWPQSLIASAHVGGEIAHKMKYAGWDFIIIEGEAKKPCYLYIHNDHVELRDAHFVWNQGTKRSYAMIAQETNADASIGVIGPAGENLVPMSNMMFDKSHSAGGLVVISLGGCTSDTVDGKKRPHYVMVFDQNKCVGCGECKRACNEANHLPPGRSRVLLQRMPGPDRHYIRVSCQQCVDSPCVKVCPTGACHHDPETNIVTMNTDRCVGCKYCIAACPYNARWINPETKVADNCDFCLHSKNLAAGELPGCVAHCRFHALSFGDLNDPNSFVSKLLKAKDTVRIRPWLGTEPTLRYIPVVKTGVR
ncbi:MAG: aldehyde ferredoxin oxidoreductase N-terminal domain-containing protein [Sutterella wadsworthensis]